MNVSAAGEHKLSVISFLMSLMIDASFRFQIFFLKLNKVSIVSERQRPIKALVSCSSSSSLSSVQTFLQRGSMKTWNSPSSPQIPHVKIGPEETPKLPYLRFASVTLYPSNEDLSLAIGSILRSFGYPTASLICAKAECECRLLAVWWCL